MSDTNRDDRFRDISEIIRKLMEQTMEGQGAPVTFSVNFIIASGVPGNNPQKTVEPEAEIYSISDTSYIVVNMPGVSEENINLEINDSELLITGQTEQRVYSKKVDLPPVESESMQYRCKNGVIDITFQIKTPEEDEEPENRDENCIQDHNQP